MAVAKRTSNVRLGITRVSLYWFPIFGIADEQQIKQRKNDQWKFSSVILPIQLLFEDIK